MDIEGLLSENFSSLVLFWPVMKLKSVHTLQHGDIGPISTLSTKYSGLNGLAPLLSSNLVNDEPIKDPIVAASSSNVKEFMHEVEFITFFTCSSGIARAEEEIFGQRHLIALYEKNNQTYLNLDGFAIGAPLQLLHGAKFQYFPRSYVTWDDDAIANFEGFLSDTLSNDLFHALLSCLSKVEDKEAKRDRARILISIKIFNEAMIPPNIPSIQTFSKSFLILLGAAFEALLNLPNVNIEKAFQHSVMLLAGNRSTLLKRWCEEFYNYRSRLAHGDVEWYSKDELFKMAGNRALPFPRIASALFVHCLKCKLFLMGLFPEYERDEFLIESFS